MLREVKFENFRILRDAVLPLGPLTVLVGANSSGKSTAILGLQRLADSVRAGRSLISDEDLSRPPAGRAETSIVGRFGSPSGDVEVEARRSAQRGSSFDVRGVDASERAAKSKWLAGLRSYSFDAELIRSAEPLVPSVELGRRGEYLAVVLDRLRDEAPERFAELNAQAVEWFGEFDQVLFDTPRQGFRSLALRRVSGRVKFAAEDLSEGTLFALAMLTLSRLPSPPSVACFEEPERGIHPRLLRHVFDALVRLAYPQEAGESRPPTQVLVTTHSPYFLDLFKDMPESLVVAERKGDEATFERISDRKDFEEILQGGPLGDIWYSGVLGGVPSKG